MAGSTTNLLEVLTRFLQPGARPIGTVYPPHLDAPNLPDLGGREIALRRFCDFLAALPFMRTMQGPPQPFTVPRDQIFINQPDPSASAADGVSLPTIAFLTSESDDSSLTGEFLGPAQDNEDSADVYAPDTAVFWLGDHEEDLMIEVVAASPAVRRAIVEGIKQVLRSSNDASALRLSLPDYYDQIAEFTLLGSSYVEDQDAVRSRRRAWLKVHLYMPEVALANAVDLNTFLQVFTTVRVAASDSSDV